MSDPITAGMFVGAPSVLPFPPPSASLPTMRPAIELKDKLAGSDLVLGVLITFHLSLELIEIAMRAGLDYVIIDLEHLNHGEERVVDACRLARMTNFPALIRPPTTDAATIQRVMDLGPCGMMLPMVESPEQLDAVRDGMYMPPRGQRRPGGHGNYWVSDIQYETWKTEVEDHLIIIPQIESPQGVEHAEAIARHEITTALGVGPYDLSARLGVCWQPDSPEHQNALTAIQDAAKLAGKPTWTIGDGRLRANQGHRFICLTEASMFLEASLGNLVRDVRKNSMEG